MHASECDSVVLHAPAAKISGVAFREATTCDELRQICALNHRTFAEEMGQHLPVASGLLVDRFHQRNRYFIAARADEVLGMISAHPGPDYSVARKLEDPGLLAQYPNALEVRLLAIAQHARNRTLLAGLFWMVYEHAVANRHSHLLISGVAAREPMYRRLGFKPLGPAVQDGDASFIPMVLKIDRGSGDNPKQVDRFGRYWARTQSNRKPRILLLPGPVNIHPGVEHRFQQELLSHRSEPFISMFEETRALLRNLVPGFDVAIFPGAGTLANDVVAANLQSLFGKSAGLVISNGEFGERLAEQATRAGLRFRHLRFHWGEPWDLRALQRSMHGSPAWIWAVHLETSVGILNDVSALISLASRSRSLVALDSVSGLGAVPMPASNDTLHMVTGVSGKSLGSYAGIAFVYLSNYIKRALRDKTLCASFDLVRMMELRGPSTTIPSPLLLALLEALRQHYLSTDQRSARFGCYDSLGKFVRRELRASGLEPLCAEDVAAPTITTFPLPEGGFPGDCLRAGYQIAHESSYLQTRGWAQIATMGDVSLSDLGGLAAMLRAKTSLMTRYDL